MSQDQERALPQPHDGVFKAIFERPEYAADMLRTLLPAEVVAAIDLSTLELVPGTFVDAELRDAEIDLLYRAAREGRETFVYVVLEHQSRIDPRMPWRMHRYVTRVLERWERDHPDATKLPAVLPVVVAHAERPWKAPTTLHALFDLEKSSRIAFEPYLPSLQLLLIDLMTHPSERLRHLSRASDVVRLALSTLQAARSRGGMLAKLRELTELWLAVGRSERHRDDLRLLVLYIAEVAEATAPELHAFFREVLPSQTPEDPMNPVDRYLQITGPWREEQIRLEKRKLNEPFANMLLKQLARRFGPLTPEQEERVRASSSEQLEAIGERVLDAERVEDAIGPG